MDFSGRVQFLQHGSLCADGTGGLRNDQHHHSSELGRGNSTSELHDLKLHGVQERLVGGNGQQQFLLCCRFDSIHNLYLRCSSQ